MDAYSIDASQSETISKDWGSIVALADIATSNNALPVSVSLITYNGVHHSGVHEFTELMYVTEGSGTIKAGDKEFRLDSGTLLVIPAGIDHGVVKVERNPLKAFVMHIR